MTAETFIQNQSLTVDSAGAAAIVGISDSHFYVLLRTGRWGPAPIRLGRCRRYRVEEIKAWIAAGCPSHSKWEAMR